MTRTHAFVDSPIDTLTLVAEDGMLCGLYMDSERHHTDRADLGEQRSTGFEQVTEELGEYFAGQRTSFDVQLAPQGNAFQQLVWKSLLGIPYGETISYGEQATLIDKPGAARLVGSVNGQNPISIIVPCHRVIAGTGHLTGYGGGIERKQYLLDLERSHNEPKLFAPS